MVIEWNLLENIYWKKMNKEEYNKLLQTPQWKECRQKILKRDNYTCQKCGSIKNLQVHHLKYIKDRNPWEYPNKLLITLCGKCHTKIHAEQTPNKTSNENFVMLFSDILKVLSSMKGENTKNVFIWLCLHAEYNIGKVYLPAKRIEMLANDLNIPRQSVYNSLVQLKKAGVIFGGRGDFIINPEICWKGDMKVRTQFLEYLKGK